MKQVCLGVLAHVDAGKTTLSEAMLYQTGSIRKMGRVDHGDAFLDTDVQERSRGITIFSKQARFAHGGTAFTLLDTPGHVDFSAETERTLHVLDAAVLVISGTDGVQGHTQTLWHLLAEITVLLIMMALLFLVIAMVKQEEEGWRPSWGDRNDGRRLRSLSPIFAVSPYFMVTRNASQNFLRDKMELVSPILTTADLSADALTNAVAGHHVHEALSVEDFEIMYGAEHLQPEDIRHSIMVIKINKRYRRNMSAAELYDVVRGIWRASLNSIKRRKVEYVFGVYNQLIVAVYKPDE